MAQLDALLQTHGVRRETLKCVVSEEHRNEIAKKIGGDWESLATFIGVPSVEVDDIKEKCREPLDRRLAMMRRWHELWGRKATYHRLVEGLKQIGRKDLIEFIAPQQLDVKVLDKNQSDFKSQFPWLKIVYSILSILLLITVTAAALTLDATFISKQIRVTVSEYDNITITLENASSNLQKMGFEQGHVNSTRNCSFPESDLPMIHSLFVGRENDVNQALHKVATSHIVNINGAPGFGKSTLAIHVGYEVVKNGTSVRYINVEDKMPSILNQQLQKSEGKAMPESSSITESDVNQTQKCSLMEYGSDSSLLSTLISKEIKVIKESLFKELQIWSETINCRNVLILDNCDDILTSMYRSEFLSLINSLVIKSHFQLHIIIVSRERLLYLDSFDSWTVKELNQSASVLMLDKLAPAIDKDSLMAVAELVEGCPLALKVIGQLLHIHGVQLINKLREELLAILDKVSVPEQQFRMIMDVAFNRLGILKDCGYMLSLFPGTYDENAGKGIVQEECLEIYLKHSLLNDFYIVFNYRYKMHRLIKEYLQEKLSISENTNFKSRFRKHFKTLLLRYSLKQEINDAERNSLQLELHNLYYLRELLLSDIYSSSEDLAVLAFLLHIKLIQSEELHKHYRLYIIRIGEVCPLLNPNICGQLYTTIVSHLYHYYKCETLIVYFTNYFVSPCMEHFQCEVVDYLLDLYTSGVLHLSEDEVKYIAFIASAHCSKGFYVGSIFSNIIWSALLMFFALYTNKLACLSIIMWSIRLGELTMTLYIYEFNHLVYNNLRMLEIALKLLCQDVVVYIVVLLMYIPKLILSKQKYIFIVDLILFVAYCSIIYYIHTYHQLSVPCYFCQFMPVCV